LTDVKSYALSIHLFRFKTDYERHENVAPDCRGR